MAALGSERIDRSGSSHLPIKLVIVGFLGVIGKRHTRIASENPDVKLVALVDSSVLNTNDTTTTTIPGTTAPWFSTIEEMLASPVIDKPDAAIVCTPNHTHVSIGKTLAAAGIHLLIEKPLSSSVSEGKSLIVDIQQQFPEVKLLVGHHRRFNPRVVAAKKAVQFGSLGDITAVSAMWTNYKPDEYFDADEALAWRGSKILGGGVVMINLVHEIDLLHHFFGPIVKVHAEKTITRRRKKDWKREEDSTSVEEGKHVDQAEEGAALTLRFTSGVVGTFLLSDRVVSPYNYEATTGENPIPLKEVRAEAEAEEDVYRIFGTEASLTFPDLVRWSYGERKKGWLTELIREKIPTQAEEIGDGKDDQSPFARQLRHFVRVVRGEEEPNCSGEDGVRAVLVCEAIRAALDSETGTVLVPDLNFDL